MLLISIFALKLNLNSLCLLQYITNKCFLHIVQFIAENITFLLVIAQQIIMW